MIGQKDDSVFCPIIFLLKTAYFRNAARTGALAGISGLSFAAGPLFFAVVQIQSRRNAANDSLPGWRSRCTLLKVRIMEISGIASNGSGGRTSPCHACRCGFPSVILAGQDFAACRDHCAFGDTKQPGILTQLPSKVRLAVKVHSGRLNFNHIIFEWSMRHSPPTQP